MPDPIRSRAHVRLQEFPVPLGPVDAQVDVADADLLPDPGSDVVNLNDTSPNVKLHAARVGVKGQTLDALVADSTKDSVAQAHLALQGKDRFQASGNYQASIPFKVDGRVGAVDGKLAFTPETADLSAMGADIRVDLIHHRAMASVPTDLIESRLSEAKVLQTPKVSWSPHGVGLDAKLIVGDRKVPFHADGALSVLPDGKLRVTLEPVKAQLDQLAVTFDLGKLQASAKIPHERIWKGLEPALSTLRHPALSWIGPRTAELTGGLPLKGAFASLAPLAGPEMALKAHAEPVPLGKQLGIKIKDLSLKGSGVEASILPGEGRARVAVSNDTLLKVLNNGKLGPLTFERLQWKDAATFQLKGALTGMPMQLEGILMPPVDGRLRLQLQHLALLKGQTRIDIRGGKGGAVVASVGASALASLAEASSPLRHVSVTLEPGNQLHLTGQVTVKGMTVPVDLSGKVLLTPDGKIAFAIERAYHVNLLGRLKAMGLTLDRLVPSATWRDGDTLLIPFELPKGAKIQALNTTPRGTLEAVVQGMIPTLPAGVRFDGTNLDLDLQTLASLPAKVGAAAGGPNGLSLDLNLDRAKVRQLVETTLLAPKPGSRKAKSKVAFDGQSFLVPIDMLAGQAIPGKLTGFKAGPDGVRADLSVEASVLSPLQDLPEGIRYSAGHFDLDPKLGKDVPGKLASAAGGPKGLQLAFDVSPDELKKYWTSTKPGLAWDGAALKVDPEGLSPGIGAKVTGAVIREGDLVVELSDGTPLPAKVGKIAQVQAEGRVSVGGALVEDAQVEIRPKTPESPWDLEHLEEGAIKVAKGKVTLPPGVLDTVFHKALGKDYDKYKPRIEDGMLVVDSPLPMHLAFSRTSDGKLSLRPAQVSIRTSGFPLLGTLVSAILTPVAALAGSQDIDLQQKTGFDLPPLEDVRFTPEGLMLDFGS